MITERLIEEITKEIAKVKKKIEDFRKPLNVADYLDNFKERLNGKLSTSQLEENYKKLQELENELHQLQEFLYYKRNK